MYALYDLPFTVLCIQCPRLHYCTVSPDFNVHFFILLSPHFCFSSVITDHMNVCWLDYLYCMAPDKRVYFGVMSFLVRPPDKSA